jgi:thiol-disulfide isomerase/thioredoxin
MKLSIAVSTLSSLLLVQSGAATQELNAVTFKELTSKGGNGMIKYFQPWCGHCTQMKPDWDRLAESVHDSVFIADVNCSDEDDLCRENDVSGYPTIMVSKDSLLFGLNHGI